jgi:F-type H+-transporting ATPase subunit 8
MSDNSNASLTHLSTSHSSSKEYVRVSDRWLGEWGGLELLKPQKFSIEMPQLIPFYFLNQLSFSFLTLLALIFVFSKYILPLFTLQQVTRMYIVKLGNKS